MSSRRGSPNVKPSKQAVNGYYAMLRSAAEEGDVTAARHLIELHEQRRRESTAGWRGDAADPQQDIFKATRSNDPKSGQLPENQ